MGTGGDISESAVSTKYGGLCGIIYGNRKLVRMEAGWKVIINDKVCKR